MDSEVNTLKRSINDLFTAKMLKYSLLPFILSILLLYTLFFILAGAGVEQLGTLHVQSSQTSVQNGVAHTENFSAEFQDNAIITFLLSHAITSWIATFFIYAIGGIITLYLSIFVALIIIGFMTPYVLRELQNKHYSDVHMSGYSNFLEGIFFAFKWLFVMLLLFIVFIPLYFIPFVNIIAINFPLYYFFHKMMHYDISSNICTKEETQAIKNKYAGTLRVKSLILYLLSLIPFVIFFASIFYIIYLGHGYFLEVRKMRNTFV
ncbi:MAG: EI24 domain-containing protein [Sulfurimonas sp.]|nr:EI24 domain-containing protein [Sulfurimonas sp.]MDD3060369.1 EI24 domain-containing protein [Sulfurimonas sp.]MDD5201716.1 EI24 domain-containing protein [Sulfurimonas sp.]